jgi:hypothetical protein
MNFSVPGMPFSLKTESSDSQRQIAASYSTAAGAVTAPTDLIHGSALAKPVGPLYDPVSLAISAPQAHGRRLNHMLPRARFGNVYLREIAPLSAVDGGRPPVPAAHGTATAACS